MTIRAWRHFDFQLLAGVMFLIAFGLVLIYSGTRTGVESSESFVSSPLARQLLYVALGIGVMLFVSRLDYRYLTNIAWLLYALSVAALVGVLFVTERTFGSHRWYDVGPMQVQPSEPAKLATILLLARYLGARGPAIRRPRVFLASLGIVALPMALVFVEPDLGSSIVFFTIWLAAVTIAGARAKHLASFALVLLLLVPFGMLLAITDYQRERIELYLDPDRDPLGAGFNIIQAEISIGSGGIFGRGLLHGTQTQLDYLRTRSTDYIFSVLGEELGFVGAMILFALLIFVLFRGLRAAGMARDAGGRIIAACIVAIIAVQAFINVGVNLRIFPVTGITLPFVSLGGSSLITMFAALGLLQSVVMRHRSIDF